MTKKIKKILIANRGEIACRVMKTCRQMGIASVAVYSDADRKALHVRTADEAVHIGASPAAESYLVIDKIIAACKSSGADAVHPGYGFLSENPTFARRLQKEGITFIGPSPESMEAMGLKDAAKKLMEKAGVPVTPGYHGKDQDHQLLKAKAGMIGYPVLIKAIAGGGGKGMRKVDAEADFEDALASCQREAKSSFGDDRVLIEKYILSPRHIEVQVFGDTHGNVVHMFERDCSLQRRHQKVIEEAPAPGMTEDVRQAMTKAAIEAAKAVDYVGAGTVEFIVDGSGKLRKDGFWFMEMNTRLQVEHPVTEMITGLDLVELQIRVAQGEKLPKQKDITMTGHAIEARLYAEDPSNDFLPSIGRLEEFRFSIYAGDDNAIRIDTGVNELDSIPIYYDPMIAKIISWAKTRSAAIEEIIDNLTYGNIIGMKSNLGFLVRLISHKRFTDGDVCTTLIPDIISDLVLKDISSLPIALAHATVAILQDGKRERIRRHRYVGTAPTPWENTDAWRLNNHPNFSCSFILNDGVIVVNVVEVLPYKWVVNIGDKTMTIVDAEADGDVSPQISLQYLGEWNPRVEDDKVILRRDGQTISILRYSPETTGTTAGGNAITAPMPGKIIAVNVAVGDAVKAGDKLIIMEAMKMEMSLEAPRDGVVASVSGTSGTLVADGEVLLTLEEN